MAKLILEEAWSKSFSCFTDEFTWLYCAPVRVPDDWEYPVDVEDALDWYSD